MAFRLQDVVATLRGQLPDHICKTLTDIEHQCETGELCIGRGQFLLLVEAVAGESLPLVQAACAGVDNLDNLVNVVNVVNVVNKEK